MEVSYDLRITLLGVCPKKIKSLSQSDVYTPLFISALFTIAKLWKGPKGSRTDERMKKCKILPSATMERHLEDIMLSEINQTERQILHDLTCVKS